MNNAKKKVFFGIVKSMILCIPFLIFWYFILLIVAIGDAEGSLSVFEDAFGSWFVWFGKMCSVFCFSSIFYLRFFIKREWIIHIMAYCLTIILLACGLLFANIGENKFREFTIEKWAHYPSRRLTMYFDLEERYKLKGVTKHEVINLLGIPDDINDDEIYVYDCTKNNFVYVKFENEKALYSYYVE